MGEACLCHVISLVYFQSTIQLPNLFSSWKNITNKCVWWFACIYFFRKLPTTEKCPTSLLALIPASLFHIYVYFNTCMYILDDYSIKMFVWFTLTLPHENIIHKNYVEFIFFKTMTENLIIVAQCHGLIYKLCKKHIEKQRNLGEGEWYILFYFHHSEETLIANT